MLLPNSRADGQLMGDGGMRFGSSVGREIFVVIASTDWVTMRLTTYGTPADCRLDPLKVLATRLSSGR
jgi:hypothetical protein